MKKIWLSYLLIGFTLNAFPLMASYQLLLENEEEQEPKKKIKQVVSFPKEQENTTEEVKPSLHPAYEQYMLYCADKKINCNIEKLKSNLSQVYKDLPEGTVFAKHLNNMYSLPIPLAEQLYTAIKEEKIYITPGLLLFKKVSQFESNKKKALSNKLELLYLKEQTDLKNTLLSSFNQEDAEKDREIQIYKLGKLDYYYALILDHAPEKKEAYLLKAQEEFSNIQNIKLEKVKYFKNKIKEILIDKAS